MFSRLSSGANDDWQEGIRRVLYPWLHPRLDKLGDALGIPLYAMGHVGYNQYLGLVDESEEVVEEELVELGLRRNPIACLKELSDGRVSEGSWVLREPTDSRALIESGMQLHLTMFARQDGKPGRELYAHYEDDWRVSPLKHLRESAFSAASGVQKGRVLLDQHTFLTLKDSKLYR